MKTYTFYSKTRPSIDYLTTLHDNGHISCDCPAFRDCWHIKAVREGQIVGRTETHVSREDRRMLRQLLNEGNDVGAREFTRSLFPSMSVEETTELIEELQLQEEE